MPSPRPPQQTDRLLAILQDAGVEFVVIGGVAALAHGSATLTRDLDIAATLAPENVERLMEALRPYRPHHVTRPDLGPIQDSVERLCEFRLLLIDTDLEGRMFRVLTLDQLIEVKAYVGRPKDRIVEMELRAIRDVRGSS